MDGMTDKGQKSVKWLIWENCRLRKKKKKNQNMEAQWNKRQVVGITEVRNRQAFQKLD